MGLEFGFFEYARWIIPIPVVGIIYFAFIGYKLLPDSMGDEDSTFNEVIDYSKVPAWKQHLSLIILIITILGMIFEKQIGIKLHITGSYRSNSTCAYWCYYRKTSYKLLDMQTILSFWYIVALATQWSKQVQGAAIADTVIGALGKNAAPFVLLVAIFDCSCTY